MDLVNLQFPVVWQAGAFVLLLPALAWAARSAPWRRFDASRPVHVWYGTVLCLTGLWSLRASLDSGLVFHLLGVSLFALLCGPRLALLGAALTVAVVTALRGGSWAGFALDTLVMGVAPVLVTAAVLRASERWLAPNMFVYIFVVGFFGPGLAMFASGAIASAAVTLSGAIPERGIVEAFMPYLVNLAFGEATLTGMLITLFVVYQPAWVATFDDSRYLRSR